jgi:kinesin family member 20
MRCAIIEAETREEVMKEMSDKMRLMQERHARRLRQEVSLQTLRGRGRYLLTMFN